MSRKPHKDRRIRGRELHVMSGRDLAAQKRMRNPLTELTPKVVRNLYETYRKGFMADIQLNWDAIEEYDETLGTVVDRRQSALGEMDWDVRIDQRLVGDNAALQELAEQQRVYMAARFNRVGNLMEAVKWLGMANFRRATFVQVFEQPGTDEEVWRRVPPWCISHPDHEGAWVYDEAAATYPHKADEVLMEHVIFREVERPIDLPCLALVVAKNMGITNWDGFLDTFGIPAVMVKMPPDTTDERREEFMDIAREIIGDGRGVFPDGTEINTIEATQNFANSFTERVDWCDKAMVRRATGGMLTVLAESGSGTLAGSAHMEAFRQLAANDAASVAECINRQYTRRVLAAAFPGHPALVRFDLIPPVTDDRAAQAQILATLAGAGFKPSAQTVSEMMGFEVQAAPAQNDQLPMTNDQWNNGGFAARVVTNSQARLLSDTPRQAETPAPQAPDSALQTSNFKPQTSSEALSEAELSALHSLASGGITAEGLQSAGSAMADALQDAVTNSQDPAPQAPSSILPTSNILHPTSVQNSCNQYEHDTDCDHGSSSSSDDREPWEKRQEEREHLEEILAELDRQEEAAADAENLRTSGDEEGARATFNEEAARDRLSSMMREGDPATREDIEKRLGELDVEDKLDDVEEDVVENSTKPKHHCQAKVRPCPFNKGTTRENKNKSSIHREYRIDQNQSEHKQIIQLATLLEKAKKPGARFDAVFYREPYGWLSLQCGRPGKTVAKMKREQAEENTAAKEQKRSVKEVKSLGHGVAHVLEDRHHISPKDVARALVSGEIKKHEKSSRLYVTVGNYDVILEREMKKGSNRIGDKAKLQTAMEISEQERKRRLK